MKVAVITPFCNEPPHWIEECRASVARQSVKCDHFFVGDAPKAEVPLSIASAAYVILLPANVNDFGDTPRAVGSMYVAGLGYDAIAFLDADNMHESSHIETLLGLCIESGASVVTSRRKFVRIDGSYMAECLTSDGQTFCDANCLFVTRKAFHLMAYWALMNRDYHAIDDRVMWHIIRRSSVSIAHTGQATVLYRATHAGFYKDLSEPPPVGVKDSTTNKIPSALARWEQAGNPSLRIVQRYTKYQPPIGNVK